jgi:hypothetical protein
MTKNHNRPLGAIAAVLLLAGNLPAADNADPLATLRKKLIKIGANVVTHARYVIFQMAEVAVPQRLFRTILEGIRRLRLPQTVPG